MDIYPQLQDFLNQHTENYELEFKKGTGGFPDSFWSTYSAFANTQGGTIVVGVKETKWGVESVHLDIQTLESYRKRFWDDVNNPSTVSHNLMTEKDVVINEELGVIAFFVPKAFYTTRPIYLKQIPYGNTYKRNHEGDYKCTPQEVNRMFADANLHQPFDRHIVEGFTIERDLDPVTLQQYRQSLVNHRPDHPWAAEADTLFLRKLGAYAVDRKTQKEGLTIAGLLMFGKWSSIIECEEITHFFPDFRERIHLSEFERWENRICPDGTWESNLFQFYRRILPELYKRVPQPFVLKDGMRIDDSPLHKTLREALFNTLAHADYSSEAHIIIESSPDAIRFSNPGDMLIPISRYYQGGESICRNNTISRMFRLIGAMEQAGSGADVIVKGWMKGNFQRPILEESSHPSRVNLRLPLNQMLPADILHELKERFGKSSFETLSADAKRLLCLVSYSGETNHAALNSEFSMHAADLSKLLSRLTTQGFLHSSGYGKGTKYTLGGDMPYAEHQMPYAEHQMPYAEHQMPYAECHMSHAECNNPKEESLPSQTRTYIPYSEEDIYQEKLKKYLKVLKKKMVKADMDDLILRICALRPHTKEELGNILQRTPHHLLKFHLKPLIASKKLTYLYQTILKHPQQAYITATPITEPHTPDPI